MMMISPTEFAIRIGRTRPVVMALIRHRVIHAEKNGAGWLIDESEVEKYIINYPIMAPPKKKYAKVTTSDLFVIRIGEDIALGHLAWDKNKIAIVCNSFMPQPYNTVRALIIGTLWYLYTDDIIACIQKDEML
jgi:hypothetical protein